MKWVDWIWIRVRRVTAFKVADDIETESIAKHNEARIEPDKQRAADLRAEADYLASQSNEIRDQARRPVRRVK